MTILGVCIDCLGGHGQCVEMCSLDEIYCYPRGDLHANNQGDIGEVEYLGCGLEGIGKRRAYLVVAKHGGLVHILATTHASNPFVHSM